MGKMQHMAAEPSAAPDLASRMVSRFSILTLDGGGARGYLCAKILEHIETYLNTVAGRVLPLGAYFDLIAGTSTGGIIALALATGHRAGQIANFYEAHLPDIFGAVMRRRVFARYLRPKYRSAALRRAVQDIFGENTLNDVQTDVCAVAVSLLNARPHIFRSDYLQSVPTSGDEKLVDVALATSAAPTYFRTQSIRDLSNLADGGLCANNPTLVGLAEAFRFARTSRRGISPPRDLGATCADHLAVLSVGTGEQCAMPYASEPLRNAGSLRWGTQFHHVAIESQSQLTHALAKSLIGSAYHRINPRLDFPMALDDVRRVPTLKNLAGLSEEDTVFVRSHFTAEHAAPSTRD